MYQDLLLKEFKVRANYLAMKGTTRQRPGGSSEKVCSSDDASCSISTLRGASAKRRANSITTLASGVPKDEQSVGRNSSPIKRSHDVSKLHAESGFERLCVDAKIVPKFVPKFATIRRISLFAGVFPKESSISFFFACFVSG